ncbi:hypothetical protein P0O24_05760 [Methanotrichaceae archaeon M04Ac]|uniref:Uncharacterized protein n=1 Tax=Candidatus Methanocrinis alkalitolerans TaxID=3033395 RepID=A0ABT5XEE3_9EURY|nr:hypothetical protein [Candidatus Methanocrinis alkalitolerans]
MAGDILDDNRLCGGPDLKRSLRHPFIFADRTETTQLGSAGGERDGKDEIDGSEKTASSILRGDPRPR